MKRILNYPGSKWRLADSIVDMIPPHTTYLEPFFGSGAVLFSKDQSGVETINDLDQRVYNFFKVCRDKPEELAQAVYFTPHSRLEHELSGQVIDDEIEDARTFLVQSWQTIGGIQKHKSGWRSNIDKIGGKIHEWNEMPERILAVAERLKQVQIENQDAIELLERYNRKGVFAYVDPPYVLETRKGRFYQTEFDDQQHEQLIKFLSADFKGKVILSGYENKIYDFGLKGWYKVQFRANAEAGQSRLETLWCNFEPSGQMNLFEGGQSL